MSARTHAPPHHLSVASPDETQQQAVYSACYAPAKEIMQECYNEVRSGNEIRSVVMQGGRLNEINTGKIDATFTWKASLVASCSRLIMIEEMRTREHGRE